MKEKSASVLQKRFETEKLILSTDCGKLLRSKKGDIVAVFENGGLSMFNSTENRLTATHLFRWLVVYALFFLATNWIRRSISMF